MTQEQFTGLKDKAPDEAKLKTWPNWTPIGNPYLGTYDAFGTKREPTKAELVRAFDDIAFACASLIAQTVATTPIKLFVKTDQGQARPKCQTRPVSRKTLDYLARTKTVSRGTLVEEVTSHPSLELLCKANPYHNRMDLFELTELSLEVTGNAYWLLKFDPYGLPASTYLLPSQDMEPIRDKDLIIQGWKFGQGEEQVIYNTDEIIHFKMPSLLDPYGEGMPPLRAAWQRVVIGMKELGFIDSTLENQGRPDVVISPNEPISIYEAERLAKDWTQRYRGSGSGGPFVADGPLTVTPINYSPRDMWELQVYKEIKTAVCNCFHVPPDLLEIGEANRATAEAALYALAVHCIKPRMARLVHKLNERLLSYYGEDRLFFEADEVVPDDKSFELQETQVLLNTGCVTRDEVRAKYGYSPTDWAAEPLLPPGATPALAPMPEEGIEEASLPVDRSNQAPAIQAMQQSYYAGQLPREACISNAKLLFAFTDEEAQALFPAVDTVKRTDEDQAGSPAESGEVGQDPATPEQAEATATNDLRATVGGSQQVMALQAAYYSGQVPREAAIANAVLIFGFTEEEAGKLFPELPPNAPAAPAPDQADEGQPGDGASPLPSEDELDQALKFVSTKCLDLPDFRQEADFDCGAAATRIVCGFFGVGPETEQEYIEALGTTEVDGTAPAAICTFLTSMGLEAVARQDLTLDDLKNFTAAGSPVICPIQDYESGPAEIAHEESGHYVVICGTVDNGEDVAVEFQDPSAGKVQMPAVEFLSRWEDRDEQGEFVHFGIAVSRPREKCGGEGGKPGPCPKPGSGGSSGSGGPATAPKPAGEKPAAGSGSHDLAKVSTDDVKAGKLEAIKRMGKAAWDKLPAPVKKATAVTHAVAKKFLYVNDTPLRAGLKFSKEVAKQRGLSPAHVERVGKIVNAIDQVATLPVIGPYKHIANAMVPALGPVASYIPVAALTYVAYSTVRNPVATMKAAREVCKNPMAFIRSKKPDVSPDLVEKLFHAFDQAGDRADWFEALLSAAVDQTHDGEKALELATKLFEEMPQAPADEAPAKSYRLRRKGLRKKSPDKFAAVLQGFFRKQAAAVGAKVKALDEMKTKAGKIEDFFDWRHWAAEMYKDLRPVVQLYYDYAAKDTAGRLDLAPDFFSVVQPKLSEGVDKATLLFCNETNETTSMELSAALDLLRKELTEGLTQGDVKQAMMERVKSVFDQAENLRAWRIAVTEGSRAQHAAQEITAIESGIVKGKRWILSDEACPECLPLRDKVVPLGDNFTTVEGNPAYSDIPYPPLHPHCRCDMIEVVEGVND
jgi:HK97 family phage portal protein